MYEKYNKGKAQSMSMYDKGPDFDLCNKEVFYAEGPGIWMMSQGWGGSSPCPQKSIPESWDWR